QKERGVAREAPLGSGERRNVPLLRGSARAFAPHHGMVHDAWHASKAICHLLGWRPWNHGGCEPRSSGGGRLVRGAEHPASPRAAPEPLHHAGAEFLLPLF